MPMDRTSTNNFNSKSLVTYLIPNGFDHLEPCKTYNILVVSSYALLVIGSSVCSSNRNTCCRALVGQCTMCFVEAKHLERSEHSNVPNTGVQQNNIGCNWIPAHFLKLLQTNVFYVNCVTTVHFFKCTPLAPS